MTTSCIAINWLPAGTVKAWQQFSTSPVGRRASTHIYKGNSSEDSSLHSWSDDLQTYMVDKMTLFSPSSAPSPLSQTNCDQNIEESYLILASGATVKMLSK